MFQYDENDYDTDDKGKFLKPSRITDVLHAFQTGQEAKQYFEEDMFAMKVYLKSSLTGDVNVEVNNNQTQFPSSL